MFSFFLLLLLLAIGSPPCHANPHQYDRPISQVRVFGNEKTQTRFILKWAKLQPGDILTRDSLKQARQNILDTSLFKQVTLKVVSESEAIGVDIEVEEKNFTLLLPRLSRNSNGDLKSGIKLRLHNIAGANQTLNMLVEQTDLSNGDDDQKYRIDYKFPQYSKPYYFKWRLSQSTKNTLEDGFSNTVYNDNVSFSVARDFHLALLRHPLTLNARVKIERLQLEETYPVEFNEVEAGDFNRLALKIEYDNIHHQRFRRFGRYVSLSYQQGLSELNSDYISRIVEFESIVFRPLNSLDNINSRIFIGISEDSPFNSTFYDLGGADNVRGLERDVFSGDALIFTNFEYVVGYHNYPSIRNSIFLDVGNVYKNAQSIDPTDLYLSVGLGVRWKLTSFIKTDLFIDVAYQPDGGETFVYGGTSLNF